jgi:preprotein translocase subunit SecF
LSYLWFRFEWQFAVGAVIATMHDLLLTVGFFSITQLEFNTTSIAAILTIVGYSLNETVVVLDRIRENMRKYKKLGTANMIDMSINAVLPRTIMTATTVMLALIALVAFGGQVIRSFSLAMIWGIFVATYSSIFICSPMLIYLGLRNEEGDKVSASQEGAVTDTAAREAQAALGSETKESSKVVASAKKKPAQPRKPRQA